MNSYTATQFIAEFDVWTSAIEKAQIEADAWNLQGGDRAQLLFPILREGHTLTSKMGGVTPKPTAEECEMMEVRLERLASLFDINMDEV